MNKKVDMFHPNLYRFYISRASVHHCRLRLGLSARNSQRFQYGFISNMSCDSCNYAREDVRHYIFFCPAFAAQRLLYGLDNFPEDTNFNIFSLLQMYLSSSKRFST